MVSPVSDYNARRLIGLIVDVPVLISYPLAPFSIPTNGNIQAHIVLDDYYHFSFLSCGVGTCTYLVRTCTCTFTVVGKGECVRAVAFCQLPQFLERDRRWRCDLSSCV